MLKAIHVQEDHAEALAKAKPIVQKLREMQLRKAADLINNGVHEILSCFFFSRGTLAQDQNKQSVGKDHA